MSATSTATKAIATAAALPSAAIQSNGGAKKQTEHFALQDLRELYAGLAQEHKRPAAYLRAAIRETTRQHGCICFGMKGRVAVETLADFARIGELSPEEVAQLRQWTDQSLIGSSGETNTSVSGPFALGRREIHFITIGANQQEVNQLTATFSFGVMVKSRTELELTCAKLQAALAQAFANLPRDTETVAVGRIDPSLETAARVSRYGSTQEFAFALVSSLSRRFQCEQVSLGIHSGPHVTVVAVSGMESFKACSPGVMDIQQAMEESLDVGETLVCLPQGQTSRFKTMPVHTQWSVSTRTAVCSIPLFAGEQCVAVVSLRRDLRVGFRETELAEIIKVVEPFGAAIDLALRGERTVLQHGLQAVKGIGRALLQPKTKAGIAARLCICAVLAIFLLGQWPYRPLTSCVVVPANLTQSLAPFDMQLSQVHVRSGDRVAADQLLASFDTRQLELERARLKSQRDQAEVDVRAALVAGDAAGASLAKATAVVWQKQLDAVQLNIDLCSLRAPADGMVVQAELREKIGQMFPQGAPILSFAPMDAFELELRIPEQEAKHIQPKQQGNFMAAAEPGRVIAYTIDSMSGSAELIGGKNVFVARAKLSESPENLRNGMEGFASTHTGWRPIAWIALHRIYEYACTKFWF
jgi:hypothetical protein